MAQPYGNQFYAQQMAGSYRSAERYIDMLSPHYRPSTIVDVGCGRGTWLRAFSEAGARRVVGVDGPWNQQSNMVSEAIEFRASDLNRPIELSERFEMAISVEVAEHLVPASAPVFVNSLASLSDVVLFGAAYVQQGGVDHLNEQPHTFWAELFKRAGYDVFDLFRAQVWGDDTVEYWYQQNTFLYVRAGHPLAASLSAKGIRPIANLEFMNAVHPSLFHIKVSQASHVSLIKESCRGLKRSLKRRFAGAV